MEARWGVWGMSPRSGYQTGTGPLRSPQMRAYAVRIERLRSCCNNACDALGLQLLVVSIGGGRCTSKGLEGGMGKHT